MNRYAGNYMGSPNYCTHTDQNASGERFLTQQVQHFQQESEGEVSHSLYMPI